ncbi:hypothetical protein V6N12_017356 [Hibiscus sabdariffa]|uniref:Endonuclease/exonuclease/phosphatase domain-containing protein n=1 Tax=Hibiscus sabdariffa TaxID=183260 RepID=A0ABR2CFB1_9ROSI
MDLTEKMESYGGLWVVGGDFNTIRSREEKVGRSFNASSMRALAEFIDGNGLLDIPLSGSKFTWSNFRECATQCRLDRLVVSPEIIQLLPNLKRSFTKIIIRSQSYLGKGWHPQLWPKAI